MPEKDKVQALMSFFNEEVEARTPKGKDVTYDYLQRHISERYAVIKRLLGVDSLTPDVMKSMVKKVFEDHGLQWSKGEPSLTRQHGWFKSFMITFGSRGGVKAKKLREQGHVPAQSFKVMKRELKRNNDSGSSKQRLPTEGKHI